MAGHEQVQPPTGEFANKVEKVLQYSPFGRMLLESNKLLETCDYLAQGYKESTQGLTLEEAGYHNDDMSDESRAKYDIKAADFVIGKAGLFGIATLLDPNYKKRFSDDLEKYLISHNSSDGAKKYVRRLKLELARREPFMTVVDGWSESTKHYALWMGLSVGKAGLEAEKAKLVFSGVKIPKDSNESQLFLYNQEISQCTRLQGMLEERR